jgi:hypothetical protein
LQNLKKYFKWVKINKEKRMPPEARTKCMSYIGSSHFNNVQCISIDNHIHSIIINII